MATPPFAMSKFLSSEDMHKAAHKYYKGQCAIHEGTIRVLRDQIVEIREAWEEFCKIDSDYTYHLEEGGDSEYTRQDVAGAWLVFNTTLNTERSGDSPGA